MSDPLHKATRSLPFALCLALSALVTSAVRADDAAARAEVLFRSGREASKVGDHQAACQLYEQSQALDPKNGTLLNLALCRRALGLRSEARNDLEVVLGQLPRDDVRRELVERNLAELRAELDAEAPRAQPAEPAAAVTQESSVQPAPMVAAAPPRAEPTAPAADAPARTSGTLWAYTALGVGGAALVVAGATGLVILDRRHVVEDECEHKRCTDRGLEAGREGKRFVAVSSAALGLGVVGIAVGAVLMRRSRVQERRLAAGFDVDASGARLTLRGSL